jgi:Mn-containing catalase
MFLHNKRLQYTVRVAQPNPGLANLLLEQFGGANGELAGASRYFTQALAEEDPGRKDLLMDIATEELSHLEIVGSIIVMLNKARRGEWPKEWKKKARCIALSTALATTPISPACCTASV